MSLDKRLNDILDDYGQLMYLQSEENGTPPNITLAVEAIKQAFIDEGWTHVDKRGYRDEYGREYIQYTFPNEYARVPQFDIPSMGTPTSRRATGMSDE